jgi:predicted transcriptional regulator
VDKNGDVTIDDETLKTYAYVNISTYRVKTVKALKDDVKTPTSIAADAGIRPNHISKVLRELKECGVVVCLNEQDHRGRNYKLTDIGDEIVDYLDNMGR